MMAIFGVWFGASEIGSAYLWHYATTSGVVADAPLHWPAESPLAHDGGPVLVMLAHPKCACTRASLTELGHILAAGPKNLTVYVLFAVPPGTDSSFAKNDLWAQATALTHAIAIADIEGQLSHTFGAYTSGQVLLYDSGGALVFSGGVTVARGHEGDNSGSRSLVQVLDHLSPESVAGDVRDLADMSINKSQVYGCDLNERRPVQ